MFLTLSASSRLTFPAPGARVQRSALVEVTSPAATPYANGGVAGVALPVRASTAAAAAIATSFTRPTLTNGLSTVDRDDVRRLCLAIAVAAAVALPAGAQSGSGWVRHQGKGFSLELPASWADESKDRIRLIREVRRLAGDDPQIAALMDNLLAVRESNFAVKMIAFDLAPSSVRTGFATNLNVVAERTALPLAAWRRESLKQLMNVDFVVQPIWWRNVKLPAG